MRNDYGTRPYKPRFVKNASKKNKVAAKKNKNKKSQKTMFKKLKSFICKLFHIKACKCDDVVTEVEPLILKPTHCIRHSRFRASCLECKGAIA